MNERSTILLVEDNADDYEATVRSLKKCQWPNPVQWCQNGQEALDYLYREGRFANDPSVQEPALILLDLNMPGVDGRSVLKKLKEDPEKRSIPIVVLTTSNDPRDIEQCYRLGANTYVQKPVDYESLTLAIRTIKDYWFGIAIRPQ